MSGKRKAHVLTDPMAVEARVGSIYPAPLDAISKDRVKRALGDATGLTNYGVNLVHLPPGQGSSHRHWHARQDEFIYILEGEVTLITDAGEQVLTPGMAAGFPAGAADGHHLVNNSTETAVVLEVGDRTPMDETTYPDVDLHLKRLEGGGYRFFHKDGRPYEDEN